MKRWIAMLLAGSAAAGAAAGERPAAFDHRLPAEHTVEVRTMPRVDNARLLAEDLRNRAPRRTGPKPRNSFPGC